MEPVIPIMSIAHWNSPVAEEVIPDKKEQIILIIANIDKENDNSSMINLFINFYPTKKLPKPDKEYIVKVMNKKGYKGYRLMKWQILKGELLL